MASPGDINTLGERVTLLLRDFGATCGGIAGDAEGGGFGMVEDEGRGSGTGGGGRCAATGDLAC